MEQMKNKRKNTCSVKQTDLHIFKQLMPGVEFNFADIMAGPSYKPNFTVQVEVNGQV